MGNSDLTIPGLSEEKNTIQLARVSTIDALVMAIEQDIINGLWNPGDQITEIELVNRYEVSRHSVREALVLLVSQRYLEKRVNKGVFMRSFSRREIEDVFYARRILEEEAVRQLTKKGEVPEYLRSALAQIGKHAPDHPWYEMVVLDYVFHQKLVETLNSPRVLVLFNSMMPDIKLITRKPTDYEGDRYAEHGALLEAIAAQDVGEAVRTLRVHLVNACAVQVRQWENTLG